MSMLTRKLFGRTTKPAARTRLDVENLCDRIVPTVSTSLVGGTLSLVGDGANDAVTVRHPNVIPWIPIPDLNRVAVTANGVTTNYTASNIQRITFDGGAGNDSFANWTAIPGTYTGGPGIDILAGGNGDDVFQGSAGPDKYTGNGGRDTLYRNGNRGYFADGTDKDTTVGMVTTGRFSAGELRANGQLNVALSGQDLQFYGPSGAGFVMRSTGWTVTYDRSGPKFSTNAAITLRTAWGDLTLPATGATTSVVTTGTGASGVGKFGQITVGGVPMTNSGLTNTFSEKIEKFTDGDVGLPNISWGIALGTGVGDDKAPLNPAVPYLFGRLETGYSFGYENVSVSTPNSYDATFAFSPGDGTIYAGITGLPLIGDFGIGVSTSGYLPYTPEKIPDGIGDPNIYGHYYVRGKVSLDDAGIPVALSGEMVVDLDANDNGQLLGGVFDHDRVTDYLDTFTDNLSRPQNLLGPVASAFNDVAIGVNTGIDLEFYGISMSLGSSSLWMKPGEVAFRGGTNDPLAGIPMASEFNEESLAGIDVQGFVRAQAGLPVTWGVGIHAGLGVGGSGLGWDLQGGSMLGGFMVSGTARLNLDGFGQVEAKLTGFFGFNGDWFLQGTFEAFGSDWGIRFGERDGDRFFEIW